MPVILSPEDVEEWLNPDNTKIIGQIIESSFLGKEKEGWKGIGTTKVAPHVNSIKEKSGKCIMTFEEYQKELDKNGIMKFFKKIPVQTVDKDGETIDLDF